MKSVPTAGVNWWFARVARRKNWQPIRPPPSGCANRMVARPEDFKTRFMGSPSKPFAIDWMAERFAGTMPPTVIQVKVQPNARASVFEQNQVHIET